ncbi:MAG: DNA-formamidopyrimidine glycosylase family protein [Bacteroidota bacterium]
MPEGPSIVILRELLVPFEHRRVTAASGTAKIDMGRLKGKTIQAFRSHGKHTLICFNDFFIRIHLLMFGSYLINEKKNVAEKLHLQLGKDEVNFYTCHVKLMEGKPEDHYDFERDVMNKDWSAAKAKKSLKEEPAELICDELLNQEIFAGVGNIIKNEVLFRTKLHPLNKIENIPGAKLTAIIKEAREYSFDFLKWKKDNTLSKHWEAHKQKICPRCDIPFHKTYPGKSKRRTYYCNNCQELYPPA